MKIGSGTLKPVKTAPKGHNANVFDTPLLIQSTNQRGGHIRSTFQELNLHFADSQTLARHLVRKNNDQLRYTDGRVPKETFVTFTNVYFKASLGIRMKVSPTLSGCVLKFSGGVVWLDFEESSPEWSILYPLL